MKTVVTTGLRFEDKEMFEAIKKSAKQNHRSMNAEILRAIEYYLKNAPESHYWSKIKEEPVIKRVKTKI